MVGKTVGHYEIVSKLGEGGMGVVYQARDTHLDRLVAIKVLPPEKVTSPERRKRFVQEAKAASALNHPNIVTVHDIGHDDGLDFIVMEYIDGKSLDELITRKGLRQNEVLKYAVQIADAMATAHDGGIVHRDLKPANVIVTDKGVAKVLDFGLAKLTETTVVDEDEATRTVKTASGAHTEEGTIIGTVSYMSPEQAQGQRVDARSDIFNIGAMLYEMVTGVRAFRGESRVSTLGAIIHTEPAPLGAEVPRDLQRLITRCLRKDPDRRFQSMKDVKVELLELKEESDSGTLAAAAVVAPARPGVRWGVPALVAAVVVVAAAGVWLWFGRSGAPTEDVQLQAIPLTSFPGRESFPSFSPDGTEVAFAWNGDEQDNFDIYVQLIGSGPPQRLTSDPDIDSAPAWSPDGGQVAFLRSSRSIGDMLSPVDAAVILVPSRGGRERRLADITLQSPVIVTLAWHPDGKHLVVTDDGTLVLVSAESGQKQRLTAPKVPGSAAVQPAFSPDGRRLVFSDWRNYVSELHLLSLDDALLPQGEPEPLTSGLAAPSYPVWTADGQEVIFSSGPAGALNLWRVAVAGSRTLRRLTSVGDGGTFPTLSRDGHRLAYVRSISDANIYRMDVSGDGTATPGGSPLCASTQTDRLVQLSPDGSRLAFTSNRSGTVEVWVCEADGSQPVQLTNFKGPQGGTPRWSPDGQQLVFDFRPQGQSDIFVIGANGGTPRQLTTDPAVDQVASWSHDGKSVYFTSTRSGNHEIWKMPTEVGGTEELAVRVTTDGGNAAFESYDGNLLYYYKALAVWQVPVEGGEETQIIDSVRGWGSFAVAEDGIYFVPRNESEVRFFNFSTRDVHVVAAMDESSPPWGLAVSRDGSTIWYSQYDSIGSDLMLVDNFR